MKPVIAVVFSVLLMLISAFEYGHVAAQRKTTSARRQQELVKQISQRAERLYKMFITNKRRNDVSIERELNNQFEDLLLTIDGLIDPHYRRHNLVIAMRIASAIERLLLLADVHPEVVLAWARLHADLDLLAKAHGIKWNEAVITTELIAESRKRGRTVFESSHAREAKLMNFCPLRGQRPTQIRTKMNTEITASKYIIPPIHGPCMERVT